MLSSQSPSSSFVIIVIVTQLPSSLWRWLGAMLIARWPHGDDDDDYYSIHQHDHRHHQHDDDDHHHGVGWVRC